MHNRISRVIGYPLLVLAAACGNGGTGDKGVGAESEQDTDAEPSDDGAAGSPDSTEGVPATDAPGVAGASAEDPGGGGLSGDSGGTGSGAGAGGSGATGSAGIGGTGGGAGASDPAVAMDLEFAPGEVCERGERLGTFRLSLGDDRTTFAGTITDAIVPSAVFELLAEEGPCQLLAPRSLFCDPECESGTTCDDQGSCIPTPANLTVGDVSVTGLLAPLDASPHPITSTYSSSILDPFPAFEVGSAILLSASGEGNIGPFALEGTGIASMVTSTNNVPIQRDMPASFTWDASGADPETSAVYIDITVNPHGSTTSWIECRVEDTGEFDVPASLVTQLVDLGLSGFPRATLGRRSTDGVRLEGGCVDLRISSELTLDLAVEGLVSCNTSDECPDGQSCSSELHCQSDE
jgi:hypothetical protein